MTRLLSGLLMIVLFALTMGAAGAADSTTDEATSTATPPAPVGPAQLPVITTRYQDWTVDCQTRPRGDRRCIARQELAVEGRPPVDKPFLALRIGKLQDDAPLLLEVTLPLGVMLAPGLEIRIDETKIWAASYQRCTDVGCSALLTLDPSLNTALIRAQTAEVQFRDSENKPFVLPVSLLGYRDARRTVTLR